MRVDKHAVERKTELEMFCVLVQQDREENDETAEYERTKNLESNPTNAEHASSARTLDLHLTSTTITAKGEDTGGGVKGK